MAHWVEVLTAESHDLDLILGHPFPSLSQL